MFDEVELEAIRAFFEAYSAGADPRQAAQEAAAVFEFYGRKEMAKACRGYTG